MKPRAQVVSHGFPNLESIVSFFLKRVSMGWPGSGLQDSQPRVCLFNYRCITAAIWVRRAYLGAISKPRRVGSEKDVWVL